jgi:hypothetical protein
MKNNQIMGSKKDSVLRDNKTTQQETHATQ